MPKRSGSLEIFFCMCVCVGGGDQKYIKNGSLNTMIQWLSLTSHNQEGIGVVDSLMAEVGPRTIFFLGALARQSR